MSKCLGGSADAEKSSKSPWFRAIQKLPKTTTIKNAILSLNTIITYLPNLSLKPEAMKATIAAAPTVLATIN